MISGVRVSVSQHTTPQILQLATLWLVNQNVRSGKVAVERTHCEQTQGDREVNKQSTESTLLLILSNKVNYITRGHDIPTKCTQGD